MTGTKFVARCLNKVSPIDASIQFGYNKYLDKYIT